MDSTFGRCCTVIIADSIELSVLIKESYLAKIGGTAEDIPFVLDY